MIVVIPPLVKIDVVGSGLVRLVALVTTTAELAAEAEANAAAPATTYKSFRIPDLPSLTPKCCG
jgi:hypothetical protein